VHTINRYSCVSLWNVDWSTGTFYTWPLYMTVVTSVMIKYRKTVEKLVFLYWTRALGWGQFCTLFCMSTCMSLCSQGVRGISSTSQNNILQSSPTLCSVSTVLSGLRTIIMSSKHIMYFYCSNQTIRWFY